MTRLTINLIQGSISFNFDGEAAKNLQQEIAVLMQSLKAVASHAAGGGGKPQPQPPMEYRYTGEIFLEVFCNPNIYPSPFAAKVLLTIRDDRIRMTSEAELTQLIEDVNLYLEQVG
ncbi:hypothetical protein STA3757_08800 [Stanieria sp. NIES-3757]|nr:hypothetical protein STA3757_08800 [Stanieria sp. NIES-3757]